VVNAPAAYGSGLKTVPQIFDPEGKYIGGYSELEDSFK